MRVLSLADRRAVRHAASRLTARLHAREDGFTLVELLVTILILGLVMGATVSMLSTTYAIVPGDIEASHSIEDAQVGINRMTRELRQATTIAVYDASAAVAGSNPSGDQIRADFGTAATAKVVIFQCNITSGALKACTRKEGTVGSAPTFGAGGSKLVDSISNGATKVFSQPAGTPVKFYRVFIKIKSIGNVKSPRSGHSTTIDDGFYARNT
jgi:prepilin-type N-terminal cleavage/methylation domain-containing protein